MEKKKKKTIKTCFCLLPKVVCFQSYRVHVKMNVESVIENLQRIAREKEMQKSEHK
jgi:hypothetical protein